MFILSIAMITFIGLGVLYFKNIKETKEQELKDILSNRNKNQKEWMNNLKKENPLLYQYLMDRSD